ncbi:MAG: SAM-dependent chlorinase/fluorinase [Acidobacteria bacterium]|nr:SAM-dependent chlorinase/fluorinase [Acidobacteriota bacterium]
MARPVIALLTDFGTRDHYAGTMKGVALSICPDATLVDISHEVPPHDRAAGALELAAAYRYFPPGTVFLVVVDPGVGSSRRGLAVETAEYRFVAPDNGVLTAALDGQTPRRMVDLSERSYARDVVSRTFEGRDRFAPAAAWLARGVDLSALGPAVRAIVRLDLPQPRQIERGVEGEVVRVDRFGNLVTNIDRRTLERFAPGALEVQVGPHQVARIVSTYADAPSGGVCALFGSTDCLEVAVNGSSAADRLALGRGAAVRVVARA